MAPIFVSIFVAHNLEDHRQVDALELQELGEDMKRHAAEYSDGARVVEVFGRRIENLIGVLVYSAETLCSSSAMCALSGRGV